MNVFFKFQKRVQALLQKAGYYVYVPAKINGKVEFEVGEFSYGPLIPNSNFCPWQNDNDFKETFKKISDHTLVDVYKGYELWKLADEVLKLSDNLNFIEIGVWRGGTGALLSKRMQRMNSKGILYLADTFTGVVKTGTKDTFYKDGEHKDASRKIVEDLFGSLQLNNYEILEGIFPDDTAHAIPANAQFGFCHIDVDVYQSAKDCLNWVWDKMAVGGIVVFDDYGFHRTDGVTKLGEEQRLLKDRIFIHNLNGHGIIVKIR
jgi:O-methyltransferase